MRSLTHRHSASSSVHRRCNRLQFEPLEPRRLLAATPFISEFMAINDGTINDEDGDASDWLEIAAGPDAVDLDGWYLTDKANDLTQWRIPDVTLGAGRHLLVFASGKDRVDTSQLHANFKLDGDGEYLALVRPDGSIAHEYAPEYPAQYADVSFGLTVGSSETSLVEVGDSAQMLIPDPTGSLPAGWTIADFVTNNDWITEATTGIGFDTGTGGGPVEMPADYTVDVPNLGQINVVRADLSNVPGGNTVAANAMADWSGAGDTDPNRWYEYNAWEDGGWAVLDGAPNIPMVSGNANPTNAPELITTIDVPDGTYDVFVTYVTNMPHRSYNTGVVAAIEPGGIPEAFFQGPDGDTHGGVVIDNPPHFWEAHVAPLGRQSGAELSIRVFNDRRAAGSDWITWHQPYVGIGYQLVALAGEPPSGDMRPLIESNIEQQMLDVNSSVLVRMPFDLAELPDFDRLTLQMQYDDGFVAYLNGQEIARRNAPDTLSADAAATTNHSNASAIETETIDVTEALGALRQGDNLLAIHGLNVSAGEGDFLLRPRLLASTQAKPFSTSRFFVGPTPGASNESNPTNHGPALRDVTHSPERPTTHEEVVVTARAGGTLSSLADVTLHYCVMFDAEQTTVMRDDGQGHDAVAGDGTFTAAISSALYGPGEMVRWYVTADDTAGNQTRFPFFLKRSGENQSAEYFGTVVLSGADQSQLPVLHWFVENEAAADNRENRTGTRASVFFAGEFYDNIYTRVRGNAISTVARPPHKFEFNDEHHLYWREGERRVDEFNLNTNYTQKSYARQVLAYETYDAAGVPGPEAFLVRVERNGDFYCLDNWVEQIDHDLLSREGLDDEGALYKMNNRDDSTNGAEKKNREHEPYDDLVALIGGINPGNPARERFVLDNLNLPAVVNYVAVNAILSDFDVGKKNHFLYRDSGGTDLWQVIPFDKDLTFGRNWHHDLGGMYHDIVEDVYHPLTIPGSNWIFRAMIETPIFQEMVLRRLRTLAEELLQPPGTPVDQLRYEQRLDELVAQAAPEAELDFNRWAEGGTGWSFGDPQVRMTDAVELLKTQYLAARRVSLLETYSLITDSSAESVALVRNGGEIAHVLVPTDINDGNLLGTSWTGVAEPFDHSSWHANWRLNVGYNLGGAYNSLIGFDIRPLVDPDLAPATPNVADSVFIRIPFTVNSADLANPELSDLMLRMRYDDGFVAYINGVEVARSNAPAVVDWQSGAPSSRDETLAVQFEDFGVDRSALVVGENILAIHALNSLENGAGTSSNLLVAPELILGKALIPTAQPALPRIEVDRIEYNPTSSNQDEEFIKLVNHESTAIDVSGWQIDDAVEFTFAPGTVIPAGGSLFVSPDVTAFRARAKSPTRAEGHLVVGGYRGHLSNFGETIELLTDDGTLIDRLAFVGDPSLAQQFLRISEIMYHPADPTAEEAEAGFNDNGDFEYVELLNTSDMHSLVLDGVVFARGITFAFADANPNVDETTLAPGEHILVVRNLAAFQERYGIAGLNIAGEYRDPIDGSNKLSNGGETLKLEDADSSTILECRYDDERWGGWPQAADGAGASLEVVDTEGDYDDPGNWRSGSEYLGSPGFASTEPLGDVVINEVLSHTDALVPDAIELHNTTDSAIDIGGWYLSDAWGWAYYSEDPPASPKYAQNDGNYRQFRIPNGTSIPADGYLVFDEDDFNPGWQDPSGPYDATRFDLDEDHGDQVWLMEADAEGNLIRFVDQVEFGAANEGESFGRPNDVASPLAPMSTYTPEGTNSRPRIGPLLISEVMYHPVGQGEDPGADNFEFVEIHNPTQSTVALTDWRIDGGIRFAFADGDQLAAGSSLVVVSFNAADTDMLAEFQSQYGLGGTVAIVGPYSGLLDNRGERIQLLRPGTPPLGAPTLTPGLLADELTYDDMDPWPVEADGQGQSLARTSAEAFGSFAGSWNATEPSPGAIDLYRHPGDANLDDVTDVRDFMIWNVHKFTSGTDWTTGDFNGDAVTDVRDFMIWNVHKFTSAPEPVPVDNAMEEEDLGIATDALESLSAQIAWSDHLKGLNSGGQASGHTEAAVDRLLATYWD